MTPKASSPNVMELGLHKRSLGNPQASLDRKTDLACYGLRSLADVTQLEWILVQAGSTLNEPKKSDWWCKGHMTFYIYMVNLFGELSVENERFGYVRSLTLSLRRSPNRLGKNRNQENR
jgi:hypothetical protein